MPVCSGKHPTCQTRISSGEVRRSSRVPNMCRTSYPVNIPRYVIYDVFHFSSAHTFSHFSPFSDASSRGLLQHRGHLHPGRLVVPGGYLPTFGTRCLSPPKINTYNDVTVFPPCLPTISLAFSCFRLCSGTNASPFGE